MSIFIDTGLFFATQVEGNSRHDLAKRALRTVFGDRYGQPITSDYVLDETSTLVRSRTGKYDQARAVIDRILGRGDYPDSVHLQRVDEPVFDRAVAAFEQYRDHSSSFTDATTIALLETGTADTVLAFDDDFDGIVPRLDPVDMSA